MAPIRIINKVNGRYQYISKPWSFTRVMKEYFKDLGPECDGTVDDSSHKPSYSLIRVGEDGSEKERQVLQFDNVKLSYKEFKEAFREDVLKKEVEVSDEVKSFIGQLVESRSDGVISSLANITDILKDRKVVSEEMFEVIERYLNKVRRD